MATNTLRNAPKRVREFGALNPNQISLLEVTDAHQQQCGERLEKILAKAHSVKVNGFERAKTRARAFITSAHEQGFHYSNDGRVVEVVSKPLWYWQPSDLDVQPAEDDGKLETTEALTWSEEAIDTLHEKTLMYSLGVLNSKGNVKEKIEILHWIWAEDGYRTIDRTVDGRKLVSICRADEYPFTFQTCCRLRGYDYEALRAGLAWSMRDAFAILGFEPRK